MLFQNYRLRSTCLCKCLKSDVSVHPGTVNMLKGPKHCCNLRDNSFISSVHHSQKPAVGKTLP